MRLLNESHFRANRTIRPSAFPLEHISDEGLSLIRLSKISWTKLQEVAENIRALAGADRVDGTLVADVKSIRDSAFDDGRRMVCVIDDPVPPDGTVVANEAHALSVATRRVSQSEAQEIRDTLLEIFSERYALNDLWAER